jgi:putative glutathione S-transferase
MGRMVGGTWTTQEYASDSRGRFLREETVFRDRVTADGSSGFPVEAGRYHLYASLACPWAHRTLVIRKLQGLEDAVPVSLTHAFMGDDGWSLGDEGDGSTAGPVRGARFLRDVYAAARPDYTGRVTVPVLWDIEKRTIVNNESREILRMFDHELAGLARHPVDLAPPDLLGAVDGTIDALYAPVNNGVYSAGFARTQEAHEEAVRSLFAALDRYEEQLRTRRYLFGDRLTEADICLFTTLLRFDPVYHTHFKCNLRRLRDYPSLWGYVCDVYQLPGVRETVDLAQIKEHYFRSHAMLNPRRIVPLGPIVDYDEPHDRTLL